MKPWSGVGKDVPSLEHAIRTAVAAIASIIIAGLIRLPETYWAAITTLVVMQSTLQSTLALSIERIVAAALGAFLGAVEAHYFGANLVAYTIAIFLLGLCSIMLQMEKNAYRYAGVTLTVVVLIPHLTSPWVIALHRFIEVSIGISVALLIGALWPEHEPAAFDPTSHQAD